MLRTLDRGPSSAVPNGIPVYERKRSKPSSIRFTDSLKTRISGADAIGGNTRSHPEHDREEPIGRKYYAGDGMGDKAGARLKKERAYSSAG